MTRGVNDQEGFGDVNAADPPTARDRRRQRDAERMRETATHQHWHMITAGEDPGRYVTHTHDGWDEPQHLHPPRQAYPLRADGGYWEEIGPSLGIGMPAPVAAHVAQAAVKLRP